MVDSIPYENIAIDRVGIIVYLQRMQFTHFYDWRSMLTYLCFIIHHFIVNMPKSESHFNQQLREKYPFLEATKNNGEVQCKKCRGEFKILSGGNADIRRHLK